MTSEHIRRCQRCHTLYDWRSSSSRYLKMSYCGFWCERQATGFLIEDFERIFQERPHGPIELEALDNLISVPR